MKQKYTLSIADMQINVVTEESRESVDKLVGILDRKMREIVLKSKKCPKNEAALLCALEFCADKIALKEELEANEDKLQAAYESAAAAKREKAKLEEEVKTLRAMLEEAKKASAAEKTQVAPAVEEAAPVAEEIAPAAAVVEEIASAASEAKPAVSKKKSRNKVGSMFDLLTFSDI